MAQTERLTPQDLLERAARGLGKIDYCGERGLTDVRTQEIDAMATALGMLNFPVIRPGAEMSDADMRAVFDQGMRVLFPQRVATDAQTEDAHV